MGPGGRPGESRGGREMCGDSSHQSLSRVNSLTVSGVQTNWQGAGRAGWALSNKVFRLGHVLVGRYYQCYMRNYQTFMPHCIICQES